MPDYDNQVGAILQQVKAKASDVNKTIDSLAEDALAMLRALLVLPTSAAPPTTTKARIPSPKPIPPSAADQDLSGIVGESARLSAAFDSSSGSHCVESGRAPLHVCSARFLLGGHESTRGFGQACFPTSVSRC